MEWLNNVNECFFFFFIYIIPYYLYEEIQHYNVKKEEKEQFIIGAHPGIDPGPPVP